MKYLTHKYFENSFSFREIDEFNETWKDCKWDHAKSFVTENNKISKSAVRIAARIKVEFEFDLFPLIITIGRKGYRSSGGSYFMMRGHKEQIRGGELYFSNAAKLYLLKKSKLYSWADWSNDWCIGVQ